MPRFCRYCSERSAEGQEVAPPAEARRGAGSAGHNPRQDAGIPDIALHAPATAVHRAGSVRRAVPASPSPDRDRSRSSSLADPKPMSRALRPSTRETGHETNLIHCQCTGTNEIEILAVGARETGHDAGHQHRLSGGLHDSWSRPLQHRRNGGIGATVLPPCPSDSEVERSRPRKCDMAPAGSFKRANRGHVRAVIDTCSNYASPIHLCIIVAVGRAVQTQISIIQAVVPFRPWTIPAPSSSFRDHGRFPPQVRAKSKGSVAPSRLYCRIRDVRSGSPALVCPFGRHVRVKSTCGHRNSICHSGRRCVRCLRPHS